ncbi:uncharacterized protein LOC17874538 [Capsella rubella]|uniref:uncharacterized protein LOC17874538 n=1 Tax=Capsella rubella TaxID=81985 RepID=UPI000CD52A01|nr:uncharacterized protein LOC17874538 [Capsella rubella]
MRSIAPFLVDDYVATALALEALALQRSLILATDQLDFAFQKVLWDTQGCGILKGTLIHATIKKQQLSKFQRLIVAGERRIFENFILTKATGRFRVTKHAYRMAVMNITSIIPCASLSDDMYLDLVDFERIHNDGTLTENILIGERSISNAFEMSLLQIDPDLPAVLDFVGNLPKDGLALTVKARVPKVDKSKQKAEENRRHPIQTIANLLNYYEEGKFRVVATIYAIDIEFAWYYFVCLKCNKTAYKVPKVENDVVKKNKKTFFSCRGCPEIHTKVEPRYKLIVCVMDSTGQSKFVLFETDATSLTHQSSIQMLDGNYDEIQDPTKIPQPFLNLVGKTFQFVVSVEKDNIRDGSDTYKVAHVFLGLDDEINNVEEPSFGSYDLASIVSGDQETVMLADSLNNNDASASDSTTPSSKRKDEAFDGPDDQTSSSKKVCVGSITNAIEEENVGRVVQNV